MKKDTFIFYLEWLRTMEDAQLTNAERSRLIDAIVNYADKNTTPTLPRLLTAIFSPIKATIDRDFEKYALKAITNRENGARGGRPKKPKETQENPVGYFGFSEKTEKTQSHDNVNDNVNDNVFVNDARSVAPTVEEKEKLFEILFWRNVANPYGELERFCDYNGKRKWKALDTPTKRLHAIGEWQPEDNHPRVRGEFLLMWHRLYKRLKEEGREDVAGEMTDIRVRCECQGAEAKIRARSETLRRYIETEKPQEILDYIGNLRLTTAAP
jgi:hypothetical protein